MWLIKSSIGRKLVMAVTGVCLVLFVTFHVLMNAVALMWPTAYNSVCEFLGANWYALVASMGLGLLFVIHIVYAFWLTLQNRAARGTDRYAVNARQPQVEWSSKNMLVLGIVVIAFMVVHLIQFWAKMQWNELWHVEVSALPTVNGIPAGPAQGTMMLQLAFSNWWTPVIYIVGFVALWFHMTHGFWSMFQTVGWNSKTWFNRVKCIANWWTSIVVLLFTAQAIVFTVAAHRNYYVEDPALQAQYAEYWQGLAEESADEFMTPINAEQAKVMSAQKAGTDVANMEKYYKEAQTNIQKHIMENGPAFLNEAKAILGGFEAQCPTAFAEQGSSIATLEMLVRNVEQSLPSATATTPTENANQPQK